MIISSLGVFTLARASDSDTASGRQRNNSVADEAADAALAVAIARIQRIGSVRGASDEASGSSLDIPDSSTAADGYINGKNSADGTYKIKIQSGQPGCYNNRQRLLTVTATAEAQSRRRYLCFWVVPRTFRFGLYVDGRATLSEAINVGPGFNLLAPPPYKSPTGARGSDVGSNGSVNFTAGSFANNRTLGFSSLYDYLFVPNGVTASYDVTRRFGDSSTAGVRWGALFKAPPISGVSTPIASIPASGVNFDDTSGKSITLATRTQPPDMSQKTKQWRSKAVSQGNAYLPGNTGSEASDFQGMLNNLSAQTIEGVTYVACGDSETITIPSGKQLTISSGALIMEGCNLKIESGAGLAVQRDLSNPYAKLSGSNSGSCSSSGELTAVPGGCVWSYPGLAVLDDAFGHGGDITSLASGAKYVDIDGNVLVGDDLIISATSLPSGGKVGNWNSSGTTYVDGQLSATGAGGAAVFRWIPQGQRMDFDSSTGRMGTYSLRSEERALPTSGPTVQFTSKPDNPSETMSTAEFAWSITDSYDTVSCTLNKSGETPAPVNCGDSSASLTGLEYPATYEFNVKACVLGLDAARNQKQWCNTASYSWYIKGPVAEVIIDAASKPSNPSFTTGATFTWTTRYNPTSVTCQIDGGSWASCASPPGFAASNLATGQTHSFSVKACNVDGCNTDSYSWVVEGVPVVNITNKPSSPQPYGNTSVTLNWTVSGASISSTQCSVNGGSTYSNCSTATSHTMSGLSTGSTQNFKLKVCNPAGCSYDTATWSINPAPPTISWSSTPANPSAYTLTSPTISWVVGGGAATSQECRSDSGSWVACTGTSKSSAWSSCATHTFEVRVSNVSGTNSVSHTWVIQCTPPTLQFTAFPANPSATFDGSGNNTATSGAFTWQVSNGVPVTGYECQTDSGGWASCASAVTPASTTTANLDGNAVNGVAHTFYVRAINSGGTGAQISYAWTIYPNKPAAPAWNPWTSNYGVPPDVDYNVGSSSGSVYYGGAAAEPQCWTGSWTACSWTPSFSLGGPGSDTTVYFRAHNISGDSANLTASVHRNSNPPGQWLWWNGDHNASRLWYPNRYITQSAIEGQFSGCYMYKGSMWGGAILNVSSQWYGSGGCNTPAQINVFPAYSCLRHDSYMRSNDSSRTGVLTREAGSTNSDANGWNCSGAD